MFLELSYTGISFRANETDKCDPLRFEQRKPVGKEEGESLCRVLPGILVVWLLSPTY